MWRKFSYLGLFVILAISFAFGQYVNVLKKGGFESGNPALFKAVGAHVRTLPVYRTRSSLLAYLQRI